MTTLLKRKHVLAATSKVVSVPYSQLIAADGAAAYWPLNDTVGSTFAKDLIGTRDAAISGGVTLGQTGPDISTTMLFDGSGLVQPPSFPTYGLQFSLEIWVNPTSQPAARYGMFTRNVLDNGDFQWEYRAGQQVRVFFFQTTAQSINFAQILPNGVWTHLVVVFTGTQVQLYTNGVGSALQALTTGNNGIGPPCIGNYGDSPTEGWKGRIADVAVYTKILTPAQILAHYKNRVP